MTESLYDDQAMIRINERHYEVVKKFRETEFSRKLDKARKSRLKGYENEIVKEGDFVFYQHRDGKAWLGPVKVFSVQNNSVFLFVNGSMKKIPRCNIQLWKSGEAKDDSGKVIDTYMETGTDKGTRKIQEAMKILPK